MASLFRFLSSPSLYQRYITQDCSKWNRMLHLFGYLVSTFLGLELLLLAANLRSLYLHLDPFFAFIRRHLINRRGAFTLFSLFLAMACKFDYTLAVQDFGSLVPLLKELLVTNSAQLAHALKLSSPLSSFTNGRLCLQTYYRLWKGTAGVRCIRRRPTRLPVLALQTRIRLALLQQLTELAIQSTISTFVVIFFFSIPPVLLVIVHFQPSYISHWTTAISTVPYLTIELYIVAFFYVYGTTLILFALQLVFLLCALLYHHGLDINRSLRYRLFHLTAAPWGLVLALANYRSEHAKLIKILLTSNHRLVSPIIFWLCLPNLACSIYFISLAYLTELNVFTRWYIILIINAQALLLPIAKYLPKPVKALYASQSTLYRAQMALRGRFWLRDKVKLMWCYELVNSETKCWFTFGPVAPISDSWLLQTSLMYTTYLLFTFKTFY